MRGLRLGEAGEHLAVLCLGAHADDIEIGAGGTLLSWMARGLRLDVRWCVLSARGPRGQEAASAAKAWLAGAAAARVELAGFPDTRFPGHSDEIKAWLLAVRDDFRPDVILTHHRGDAHQDHREIAALTPTVFRDTLILEYEIPKWDGDLGRPNLYVPLSREMMDRKIELLMAHFGSQRSKDWFDPETFRAIARLRGMECRAPDRYAEAFHMSKAMIL